MLKKVTWTENAVFSMQLRDDLFTLVQMRKNHLMQFFAISKTSNDWAGTDLNKVQSLGTRYVAEKNIKSLLVEQLEPMVVIPDCRPIERRMLRAVIGNHGDHGADLIELTDSYDSLDAKVIQRGLTVENDLDLIYSYEMSGMLGDTEKLKARLLRYFDTGVNWDASKEFIFKGIAPPPPHYQPKQR